VRVDPPPAFGSRRRSRALLLGLLLSLGPFAAFGAWRAHAAASTPAAPLVSGFRLSSIERSEVAARAEPKLAPSEARARDGFVVIQTLTGSAEVTVSGRYVGRTPIKVRVAPGSHWVIARGLAGRGTQGMRVEVPSGKLIHATLRLPE
jgi:hypothetical protein